MQKNFSGLLYIVAAAAVSFFMEPLIPLGDWRWLMIAGACVVVGWWLMNNERIDADLPPWAHVEQSQIRAKARQDFWEGPGIGIIFLLLLIGVPVAIIFVIVIFGVTK